MGERLCPPNLPRSAVKKLMIGEKYRHFGDELLKYGIDVLLLPDIPEVDRRLCGHADLAALSWGKQLILGGRAGEIMAPKLHALGFNVTLCPISGSDYPSDAVLNACVMGENIIHNRDFSALKSKKGFIHVRQGYSKCSVCPVTEEALITSDAGIARACRQQGLDVLLIEPGYILLPGFNTGFIGGCAFLLAPDLLAFTGRIDRHPSYGEIADFLSRYGISYVCLSAEPVEDIGSALLITEEY